MKHLILLSLMFFVVTAKAQTGQTLSLNSNGQASLNFANLNLSDCFSDSYFLPSRAIGDDHAMWLSNNSFPASSTDFLFDSNAKFIQNVDGTATLTGILTNTTNQQDQWEVTLYLSNGANWSQWSSLGRSYKDEGGFANGNHVNWTYYIINPNTASQLVGLQGNAGKTVPIIHMPANLNIGFQFGTGANMKNAGFGMSGWFSYSLNGTNYYQGDFNLDLSTIERVIQKTASKTDFDCDDLGSNTITVTSTDQFGNSCSQDVDITIQDITPPNVVTKNITRVIGASGSVTITANDVLDFNCSTGGISEPQPVPGAGDEEDFFARPCTSDNCTITFYDIDKKTFTCNEAGQNIVTATVRDQSGNTTTATAIVTIINNSVPTLSTKNITVELDADGNASITPQMVLNQYGIDCGNITLSLNKTTFDCSNIGENTVTLIATASNGQVVSKTATVTVVDNLAPVVVTQNISINLDEWGGAYLDPKDLLVICDDAVIIEQDGGGGGDFVPGTGYSKQMFTPVYEVTCTKDNCAIASIMADIAYFDCSNVGQNTVSITVTDVSGNSTTATAIVTVNDITPPTVVTKNINVSLDASGNASITPAQVDNGSADICGVTLSLDKDSFNCSETGLQTVTLTATDPSGNTTSKTATVNVSDITAPTVIAKNITLALDANGNASISAQDVDNGSYDNCDITLSVDKLNFDCSMVGDHNVTLTGVDPSGNSASAVAIVTVVDNTAPVISTQNITVSLNSNGTSVITTTQVASATDNCGTPTISISKNEFNCNDLGLNTVTITATDANGNVSTSTAAVTVEDNVAPTVITQNISVTLDANGNANITAAQVDNGSFDNCSLTLSIDKTSFDCSTVGDQIVTLTGVDASGNTASATAIVTVINNNAPEVNTNNVTLNLDSNGSATVSVADLVQDAVEICETTAFQGGNNHAIWLSKYTASNQNVLFQFDANGGELIQYPDGTATMTGTIVNPANANDKWIVQLNLDQKRNWTEWSSLGRSWKGNANTVGNNYKDWAYYQMSTSNPTTLTGAGSNAGQVKTLTHMPANYNYGFQIGQAANDKNGNYGMSGWFFYTNGQGQSVKGDFNMDITSCTVSTGTGPCDPASIEISQTDFDCSDLGENTVTLTITANNGQVTTKTTSVTIVDNIAPTVVTKNITVALDANGNASITAAQVDNGSSDNCNLTLSIDKTSFDCSKIGAQTVTLTGTDASGNTASATAIVTIVDNTAPTVIAQNISVSLNASGNAIITAAQIDNGSSDNCGIASITVSKTSFDCSNIGINTVTLTVTDNNGNTSTKTATVTIADNIAPTVLAKNITVALDANGNANITAAQVDNGSYDNCNLILSIDKTSFDCAKVGAQTVTLTGTDASGNTASATATVTVVDNTTPVFTGVLSDKVFQAENGNCEFAAYWDIPVATDNCLISVTSSHNPGDIFPIGTTTVIYTATDAAGNEATTQFDVTVLASPLNVVTQASSYTTNSGMYNVSCSDASDGEIMLSVTGGCAPYTFAWSNGSTEQNLSNVEAGLYSVTVTDKNGLQTQKTITLTAPDPIVIDKSVTSEYTLSGYGEENTVYLGFGEQTVVLQANASGGSGEYTYEWTPSEEVACSFENTITVAPQVTTTYTVVVTDSNGCSTTENFTIEVVDVRCTETTPPGEDNDGDDDFDCQCEGKMKSFTVVYQGFSGVTIKALKKDKSSVIATYTNVQNGDIIKVDGFDFKGRFDSKTFLQIGSAKYEIHTSCSINILGQTYGPFKVIAYTDGEGASCSLNSSNNHITGQSAPNGTPSHAGGSTFGQGSNKDNDDDDKGSKDDDDDDKGGKDDDDDKGGKDNDDDDDDKGGKDDHDDDDDDDHVHNDSCGHDDADDDVSTDCQCEGRMESFRVIYNGTSGKTITAYNKKKDKVIAVYRNVQFGDEIFVSGATETSGNPSTAGGSTFGKGSKDDKDDDHDDDDDKGGKDDKDDDHDDDDDKGGKDDKDDDHDDDDDKGGKDDKDDDHDDDDDKGGKDDKDDDHDDDDDKGGNDDDRLDSKTFLRVDWIDYEIHTSCSINILGMEVGPFKVIEYTDGEGFTCSIDEDDNGGGGNNGGCDVETVEWEGNITICYNNEVLCVNQSEVKTYLDLGASLGACPTSNNSPAGLVGGFNLSSDIISEQVVKVEISTYPNPAADLAQISFNVNKEGPVSVAVFDTRGMQVGHTLFEENAEVDKTYTVVFDASSVKEGMYIIRLNTQGYIESKKLLIKR